MALMRFHCVVASPNRDTEKPGISNGGLTAFRGRERDNWEKRLFGGVYQKPDVTSLERPKYGALDLMNHADGPSPRFGSCYFRLSNEVSKRCSFTYKDSFYQPEECGTIDDLTCIMASMLSVGSDVLMAEKMLLFLYFC